MSLIQKTNQLLQMIRFSHTIFALPFALLAAVMAWSAIGAGDETASFKWTQLVGILICMVGARSAAMAFNRLVDRRIDAKNPRTANRHLPAGTLSVSSVATFTVVSSLIFIAGTLLFLPNYLPLILSLPILLVLLGYSYAKRFTSLAHFWLGFALMLAPIAAWIAIRGEIVQANLLDLVPAVLLGMGVLLWVSGFDIIYSCQDADFDQTEKLNSVPARFGIKGALRIATLCHGLMLVVLVLIPLSGQFTGIQLGLGWLYWLALASVGILLAYQHFLVSPDDLTRVNIAFFNVNAIISFALFAFGTVDLLFV